jgi:regulator of protease activity HflC (stomatin/prohibitin superfamily)
LYTSGRSELQNNIRAELTQKLEPKGTMVEDVLLKNVVLPETLSNSIQEKARAEQESQRMEFVLKKEAQEAKRKAIEAEGIAEFQRIVAKDISTSLLQWKGIEATEKLAESPNAKVVIVGNNKGSLPVILGNEGNK